jgi:hypothetical protein
MFRQRLRMRSLKRRPGASKSPFQGKKSAIIAAATSISMMPVDSSGSKNPAFQVHPASCAVAMV